MTLTLAWMRPDAPYMPIATLGLLTVAGEACARWDEGALVLESSCDHGLLAERLLATPLPDVDAIHWPRKAGQSLASTLGSCEDPVVGFAELCASVAGSAEECLLRSLATDQARRAPGGAPARNRLLTGAKADLSSFRWRPKASVESLAEELRLGPSFAGSDSGPCMGLVPEVHTFGGTVGRTPSTIGASSDLLSLLIRHGLLSLPPNGSPGHGPRRAGGALLADDYRLSWPLWSCALDAPALRAMFSWSEVQVPQPDPTRLRARGVAAVYRSETVSLSDTVFVFRWGRRIA